jgi:hypothetical protein
VPRNQSHHCVRIRWVHKEHEMANVLRSALNLQIVRENKCRQDSP